MAAAYAENGKIEDAIETQKKAITIMRSSGKVNIIPELEKHLKSYESGKPWRED